MHRLITVEEVLTLWPTWADTDVELLLNEICQLRKVLAEAGNCQENGFHVNARQRLWLWFEKHRDLLKACQQLPLLATDSNNAIEGQRPYRQGDKVFSLRHGSLVRGTVIEYESGRDRTWRIRTIAGDVVWREGNFFSADNVSAFLEKLAARKAALWQKHAKLTEAYMQVSKRFLAATHTPVKG
jgi:hypothetical protein